MSAPEAIFREMIEAFGAGDRTTMRGLLADDLVAYVTNAEGGADRVDGAEAYLARVPEGKDATYSATVTQAVQVASDQVLAMVEIEAERKGKQTAQPRGLPRAGRRRPRHRALDGRRIAGVQRRVLVLILSRAAAP